MAVRKPIRFPLMALGMLALLAGMWGGLLRMGWELPLARPRLVALHGPLMVSAFLGTLIGLERAVALGVTWAYGGPLLSALGGVVLLAGVPGATVPVLLTAGSLGLVAIFAVIVRRQPALFTVTMGLGALSWLAGNALWLAGKPIFSVVGWWLAYLVLTIAGERLELSRMLPQTAAARAAFVIIVVVLLLGVVLGGVGSDSGARVTGAALLALTAWLLRHDIARRTVRQAGLTRFTAVCLLSGYVWLAAGGALSLYAGGVIAGLEYDATLHAVLLGFVFAMIFGHAPIIFPAVLGVAVPFRPRFYAHLVLLHATLLLRVLGDLTAVLPLRQWGGMLGAVAVLMFLANTIWAVRQGWIASQRVRLQKSQPGGASGPSAGAVAG